MSEKQTSPSEEHRDHGPQLIPFEAYVQSQDRSRADVEAAETRASNAEFRASMDVPTGVMKGEALSAILEGRIQEANELGINPEDSAIAAVVADVTGLKELNSTVGHQTATEFLAEVAQLFQGIFRAGDAIGVVGRWGGDEFLALLDLKPRELDDLTNQQRMEAVMKRASEKIEEFFATHRNETIRQMHQAGRVNVAMGYSIWQSGWDSKKLVDEADAEMYRHKDAQHERRDRLSRESLDEQQKQALDSALRILREAGLDDRASKIE